MEFLLFDVPHLYCQNRDCLSQFTGVVYFCVGDIEVNGYSVLPEIKNQGLKPECIPYALCSAEEYNGIIEKIVMGQDPSVDELDPDDLANQYKDMFPMMGNCSRVQGLHKLLYSGLILKKYGCRTVKGGGRKPSGSDLVAVVEARYEDILHLIADGRAIVAVISTKKKFHELQFGKVYSQPLDGKTVEHAVMLVGALITPDQRIYMFMNSHGREFCSLLNSEGEIVAGGIGMVFTDMPCNVIVFSRSWEEGTFGKLSGSWRTDLTSDELVAEVELLQEPFRRANSTFVDKDFNSGGGILACCYEAVDDINISMNQMRIMDLLNLNNICVLHTKSILSFCLQGNIKVSNLLPIFGRRANDILVFSTENSYSLDVACSHVWSIEVSNLLPVFGRKASDTILFSTENGYFLDMVCSRGWSIEVVKLASVGLARFQRGAVMAQMGTCSCMMLEIAHKGTIWKPLHPHGLFSIQLLNLIIGTSSQGTLETSQEDTKMD